MTKRTPPTLLNTPRYLRAFWKTLRKEFRAKEQAKKGSPNPKE
jgi:hypothetical protein